jgi:hypothetical protein
MLTHDIVGITDGAAAIACAVIAVITWRRRALNQTFAVALTFVMAGGFWWSVALAVVVAASNQTVVGTATLVTFPGPSILVTAFMCLGLTIARPQWVPRRWMIVALLVEPVLITTAGATNPWHLLVYRGPGAAQLTTPVEWTYGPVFWLDSAYGYLSLAVGLALVGWGWWHAAPAFRAQLIRELAPADALVARWGGEELFVALPGADEAAGLAFAEELRHRCEQSSIVVAARTIRCTISGGVATYPTAGTTMDELFHAADVALYEAKNAGRNAVRLPASTRR